MKNRALAPKGLAAVMAVARGIVLHKPLAGGWRRRRPLFDSLETRRLLSTNLAEFPIRVEGGNPEGIASGAGSDKNIWFTLTSNNIGMINPNDTAAGVTQYPIPTDNSGAGPIAAGPDGNYWFFEETAGQFGVINPSTGHITEIPLLSISDPQLAGITAGPNGYLWFTASRTSQIGEINTSNDQITLFPTKTAGADPYGIVEGPDGNMWFAEAGKNKIGMINPTTHAMQEFPIDSSGSDQAEGITVGPDGNLWITLTGTDKIAVMSPSNGALLHEYAVKTANAAPNSITLGPDGNLWFTESATGNIATITTAGEVTEFSTGSDTLGITSGSDGNLWFVMSNVSTIDSIGPSSHTVTAYQYTTTLDGAALDITSDSNGNLWFTQWSSNQVGELVSTTGIITEYTLPTPSSGPQGITLGPDGNLWFTEFGRPNDGDAIGWINPSNGTIGQQTVNTTHSGPASIVVDPSDGDLWFTEFDADKIGMINPTTKAVTEFNVPTANADPGSIAVDASGNIWFTERSSNKIGELSPNNPTHITQYNVNGTPYGITAGPDGNIWITEAHPGYYVDVINPSNGSTIHSYGLASGHEAMKIIVGPDGNLWFDDPNSYINPPVPGYVGSITTTGVINEYPVPNAQPEGITAGKDGNIWFTATGINGYPNVIGVVTLSSTSIPTRLGVTTEPLSSVTAGEGFGLVVSVENSLGNPDIDYNGTVTIALANNPGGDTLKGTLTATVSNGVAIFSGLTLKVPDSGYTIKATASGLSSTTTDGFNVTLGATQLVVTTEPPNSVQAGAAFSFTVSAEDGLGNVDTSYNQAITLTLGNANGATLSGVLVVGANDGVATFNGLSLNLPGNDYVILASSGKLTSATTNGIAVTQQTATQLVIHTQPSSATAGTAFSPQFVIYEEDQYGNVDTGDNTTQITATLGSGTGPLQGTMTVMVSGGVATFTNLFDDLAETITITFNGGGLPAVTSNAFTVAPGIASSLTTRPPSVVVAGVDFPLTVDAYDPYGNLAISFQSSVTIALASGSAGNLSGTLTVAASGGVASFTNLVSTISGSISLAASSGTNLTAPPTPSIPVSPAVASVLTIHSPPSSTATAGTAFISQPVIYEQDQYGNLETSDNSTMVTASLGSGTGPLQGTAIATIFGGIATFTNLADDNAETITLNFSASNLTPAASNSIVVSPAAPSRLVLTKSPLSTATAGVPFSNQPVVAEEDEYGNIITSDSASTVTAARGSVGTAILQGSKLTVTLAKGVAEFGGLSYDKAEAMDINFTINASGVSSVASGNILVSPAAASALVIAVQPSPTATAGQTFATQPVIDEVDQYGNLETGDSSTDVIVSLATGVGPLQVTTQGTVSGGVATFTDLADNLAETISLDFNGGGLSVGPSKSIVVTAGQAVHLVISSATAPPSLITLGGTFGFVVDAEDDYGNIDLTYTNDVTVALAGSSVIVNGNPILPAQSGVATFAGLSIATAGNYALQVTSGTLPPVTSSLDVESPAAAKLVLTTEPPSTVSAGTGFGLDLEVQDQFGNLATSYDGSVTVTVASNAEGATLAASYTTKLGSGLVQIAGLTLDTAGNGYTLQVSSGSLASATTSSFDVTPLAASKLIVTSQPENVVAGTPFGFAVTAEDRYGNLEPGFSANVSVSLPTNPADDSLGGTLVETASAGVVTLAGLVLDKASAGDTIQASSIGLSAAVTSSFSVTAAPATQLVVSTPPPSTGIVGAPFTIVIEAQDQFGNVDRSFQSTVTIVVANNSDGETLSGTLTATAVDGVATFTGLTLIQPTSGYALKASTSGLTPATTSNTPVVNPPPPTPHPTIIGDSIAKVKLKNKKGKPTGKSVMEVELVFSTAMQSSTTGLFSNYQVGTKIIKKVKKTTTTKLQPVNITAAYNQSTNTVTLVLGNQKFAKGGQITVINTSPNGVSSAAGVGLSSSDTTLTISQNGRGISLG